MSTPWQSIPLRIFVISDEPELTRNISQACELHSNVTIVRTFDYLPEFGEVSQLANIECPNVAIISVTSLPKAGELAEELRRSVPGIQLVAMHWSCEPSLLLQVMRLGFPEFLSAPFTRQAVSESFDHVRAQLVGTDVRAPGTDLVYSFLPAKPGSGTSTLAVNAAIAAARRTKEKIFFGDFDLSSGVVRFMLQLANDRSVVDAVSADDLDDSLWPQLVTRKFGVDFMHAGRIDPETRVAPFQARRLLDTLRRPFKVVVADLSGNFEKYSLEIMRQSRRIFLVTTPELPSLYLARDRVDYLKSLRLGDRVTVLLNRVVRKSNISESDVSSLIGAPVEQSFANDYETVMRALEESKPVKESTELGKQLDALGALLLDTVSPIQREAPKKFLEFFTVGQNRLRAQAR